MTTDIEQIKKKIIYRSNYRGTKEMDKLLGAFTNKYLDQLNYKELNELIKLLEIDDNNLYNLFKISAFSEPSLVQFMHRNLAYIIMFVYLITLYLVISNRLIKFNKTVTVLGLILLLQIVLGILTVTSGAQMFIASMHQISSILLVSFSVYFLFINTKKN